MGDRVCEMCGLQFSDQTITCPNCKRIMGGFLSRPITGYPDMKKVAVETVKALEQRWAFNPFAAGWRIVDVLGRILLIFVLVALAFSVHRSVVTQHKISEKRLESHRVLAGFAQLSGDSELRGVAYDYATLVESTGDLNRALRWNGQLFVAVLLAMICLLATSAVASYRQFKELNKVKATLRFLCTHEGRAFVGGILVEIMSDKFPPSKFEGPGPDDEVAPDYDAFSQLPEGPGSEPEKTEPEKTESEKTESEKTESDSKSD